MDSERVLGYLDVMGGGFRAPRYTLVATDRRLIIAQRTKCIIYNNDTCAEAFTDALRKYYLAGRGASRVGIDIGNFSENRKILSTYTNLFFIIHDWFIF